MLDKKGQKELAARLLEIEDDKIDEYSHDIDGVNAIYVSVPVRGGESIIVGEDGEVLYANSSVSYELHLSEYKKGRRTPLDSFEN